VAWGGGGRAGRTTPSTTGTPTVATAALNPTTASNFVLGWFRSTTHETRSAWNKMEVTSRPKFEEFAEYAANYDEMVPDSNPEVAAKGEDFLVKGKITLTRKGKKSTDEYEVLVKLVDGELKVAEYRH
jgi:hypothetical protein